MQGVILPVTPEELSRLMVDACERACRTMFAQHAGLDTLDSHGAMPIFGYQPDNQDDLRAFRAFVARNGVPCRREGRKLKFSRRELDIWIAEHPRRRSPAQARRPAAPPPAAASPEGPAAIRPAAPPETAR